MKTKFFAALAAFLLIAGGAAALLVTRGESERGESVAECQREGKSESECERESPTASNYGKDPRKEAAFENERKGEADRRTPQNPVVEQVDNRAYPRAYVDDRLALKSRRAFIAKPSRAAAERASARRARTSRARRLARAAISSSWEPLGPVTPNVTGEASQFADPATGTGPATQESGRVTAMAIDPNCSEGGSCRLWVAAAGGGIWRTSNALAAKPDWTAVDSGLPTNAFGSLIVDPNDSSGNTLYAGSGEPNGSGDSEAGLGLFKSTDGGDSWKLVEGSDSVATNRSIGAIAVPVGDPGTIYIGTDVARHGSSSVNGGRRTPPNAPDLGVYKKVGDGAFEFAATLHEKTPQSPVDPAAGTGSDWFQGGVNKLELDPNDSKTVYAAVVGYGLWRSADGGADWTQVFHSQFQSNFADPKHPGDSFGDRTEFDAVAVDDKTRIYVGDSSDDLAHAWVWRTDDAAAITGSATGAYDNSGWTQLSSTTNGTNGFLAYDYCQNGQCGYDNFVASPPGAPGQLWLGGSMNYDELPVYGGLPPRSNGRAVIRSTNGGATAPDVTWQDMTAVLDGDNKISEGVHPDLHAIAFQLNEPGVAFIGSDGGVVRVDVRDPQNKSAACDSRTWAGYAPAKGPQPLAAADKLDCQRLLSGIPSAVTPLNDGLNDIQFQSLSVNPSGNGELLGGTQDNGTWAFTPTAADPMNWFESVGGDGGQSGFDKADTQIRYHNYYDATPEVNFDGTNPREWLNIYDQLQTSKEPRSFYTPFSADPVVGGRAFTGMGHVWRTDNNAGDRQYLEDHCNALHLDPARTAPCGDWKPLGDDLSSTRFGQSRAGQYVVATERAPSDRGTLWAATRVGRVFITKNADASNPRSVDFVRLDSSSTPGRFVSGIAVDPSDANHAWISYSGYSAYAAGGHVYEVRYNPSTKSATFTDLSGDNFGDIPATGIGQYNGTVYAATDWGVLSLAPGSAHWSEAAAGMPKVAVYGLTVDRANHMLYAATHGRGAYQLGLG